MTPPGIFSVATCLSLVDTIDDKLVNIEYDRVKHLEVKKVNTRTKPSISMKRDFLRSLLIKSNLDELHGHISLEDKILQKVLQTPKSVMIETILTLRMQAKPPVIPQYHPMNYPFPQRSRSHHAMLKSTQRWRTSFHASVSSSWEDVRSATTGTRPSGMEKLFFQAMHTLIPYLHI